MSDSPSSSSSKPKSKKQLPKLSTLLSPFPKRDAKNFTEGSVISDNPKEFDSFETCKELKLNRLPYYVRQSDKKNIVKIINDPTNEILRYLESQNNTVEHKKEDNKKEDRKRKHNNNDKSQSSSKRSKQ